MVPPTNFYPPLRMHNKKAESRKYSTVMTTQLAIQATILHHGSIVRQGQPQMFGFPRRHCENFVALDRQFRGLLM